MTRTLTPKFLAGLPVVPASESRPFINMLIYGESGVGKTRLAGSADAVPSMRKVLVVDVEGGSLTLANSYPNVDVVRVKTWEEVQDVYDELYAGNHDYSTVVLDSLTEIQKFNMTEVMKTRMAEAFSKDKDFDEDIPDMRAWGKNIEQIRKFVRAYRDLDMNTIFIALAKTEKNARSGVLTKEPYLSGKLSKEVAAFLDIVVYMYMKEFDGENKRLLLTAATDEYVAKDRTNRLPMVMEDPTMESIIQFTETKPETETEKETANA